MPLFTQIRASSVFVRQFFYVLNAFGALDATQNLLQTKSSSPRLLCIGSEITYFELPRNYTTRGLLS